MQDLDKVFGRLRGIMEQYAGELQVVTDAPGNYYLNTRKTDEKGKPVFFGMVKSSKNKVAYHLMPVYCHPELLEGVSEALRGRMQGKSCFNFVSEDEAMLSELSLLTERGIEAYREEGLL